MGTVYGCHSRGRGRGCCRWRRGGRGARGRGDVACGDEVADAAGGDGGAAEDAWGVDGDGEAEFATEGFERAATSAGGVVAEAEVFALVDLGGVDGVDEDVGGEVAGVRCGGAASVKGRTRVASRPVAARSSSLRGSGVMRRSGWSGRRTRAG